MNNRTCIPGMEDATALSAADMQSIIGGLRAEWMDGEGDTEEDADLKAQWMDGE